jgi:ATP-binding cassette, subfamily B, heavy metal transporter
MIYREIKQAVTDMEVLLQLDGLKSSIVEKPDAKPLQVSKGDITFNQVSFGYVSEKKVLNNVSFQVTGGTKVGIVGTSGVGYTLGSISSD